MRLPDGGGIELELVKFVARYYPGMPTAVITAYGSVESAVEALNMVPLILFLSLWFYQHSAAWFPPP